MYYFDEPSQQTRFWPAWAGGADLKIALVGGTGTFGRGLALRLAVNNEVLIGSRDATRARAFALELSRLLNKIILGDSNAEVTRQCDVTILAVPQILDPGFQERLAAPLEPVPPRIL